MLTKVVAVVVLVLTLGSTAGAASLDVYFNDFDGTQTFGGGATGALSGITTTESVQGYSGLGSSSVFSGSMIRNSSTGNPAAATTLTLSSLPTHNSVNISFLLAIIDSWDSTNGAPSPDFFNVAVTGGPSLQYTFANTSGSVTDNPGTDIGAGVQARGFSGFGDRAYDTGTNPDLSFAHTGSSLSVSFFASGSGWQGDSDESWGMDNLRVSVITAAIPEPSTYALMLAGLGFVGFVASRRRRAQESAA